MPNLLLATRNSHKAREISEILGNSVSLISLNSFPNILETEEDQSTIEGNAAKKAREAAVASGVWALADDTGLEVDALNGAPGVFSARYAGINSSFKDNIKKLLAALSGVPHQKRQASFRTVIALSSPQGAIQMAEGKIDGIILENARGSSGFGYDPVFFVPSLEKTLAEMTIQEKNSISHRNLALKKIFPKIKTALALTLFFGFFSRVHADQTQPGQDTVWDQIMASQAGRNEYIGSEYLQRGHYDAAAQEFGQAVADNPEDPKAHMMLGVAYYWTGQVEKSLEEYQKSLELDPKSAQVYMLIGISLAWEGNSKGAYSEFKTAAKINPARPDVQMNLGSVEESMGMIPNALDHLRKATSLDPKDALYHYQLGMLYRRLGRYDEATDEFAAALEIFPDYEDALLEMGSMAEKDHHYGKALDDFNHAVDLKSRDSVARLLLAHLDLLQNQYKNARAILAQAFDLTPKEGGPGLQISIAYAGGKSKNKAQPDKNQKPKQPAQKKQSPTAAPSQPSSNDPLSVFKKNLERIPLKQGAILQVEVVFMPKPKLKLADDESSSSLKRALERKLGQGQAAPQAVQREYPIHAGNADERKAEIAQIIQDLRKTLKQAPPNANVRFGMNLTYKNLAHVSTGGPRPTSNPLNISYQPHQVGNDLGLWIMGTGWMDLVTDVLPRPGERIKHPDQTDWWTEEGLGYATLGKGPEALADFERACHLDPSNDVAWLGRAVASVIMGDEDGAVKYLRRTLAINPHNRTAQEGLKWLLSPPAQSQQGNPQQ